MNEEHNCLSQYNCAIYFPVQIFLSLNTVIYVTMIRVIRMFQMNLHQGMQSVWLSQEDPN